MSVSDRTAGYFRSGLPFNRLGDGPDPLVIFQGLVFENKPQSRLSIRMYSFLGDDYTVYGVLRKPGLQQGASLRDMASDYAEMIREEFGGPIDVMGVSTGGSIVQCFAADYPDLVRRLVIQSSAYTLSDSAKLLQLRVAELAQQGRWTEAYRVILDTVLPRSGMKKQLASPLGWLGARLMSLSAPEDPTDLVVTIEAEDRFNFKEQLGRIAAPTLVIGGGEDPFYSATLFRETAEGIPNAKLILYEGKGHLLSGKQFKQDVLSFLKEA
jgi:pimeloyl-ACP methyl ester carboxylesterase